MTLLPLLMMQGQSWWPSLLILIVICFIVVSLNFFIKVLMCAIKYFKAVNSYQTANSRYL